LVNAFSHSGVKRVELELEYTDSELRVLFRDNGRESILLEKGRD
jgi:signal transduction histidine kinase